MIFGVMYLGLVVVCYLVDYLEVNVEVVFGDCYVDLIDVGVDVVICIGKFDDFVLVMCWLVFCSMIVCVFFGLIV